MSNHQASLDPHPPKPTRKALRPAFTLAAALLAGAAGTLASPAAQAAPGDSFTAFSQSSGAAAPHPGLQAIPFHPGLVDATAPAPRLGQALSVAQPRDASTGLFIAGPVSATVSGSEADLRATAIINERTTATGTLTLDLIATTTPPPVGAISGAFLLASHNLGTLPAQSEFTNVDTGEIPFTGPSAGCYYLSLLLLENGDVVDVRTLPAGGTPETTGYSEFGFGETCPAATTCTRTANSVCLDSARFQVTVVYDNTTTGAGVGQVLLFGSTRAESDESGFFYFTDASNFELGAKVLDACTVNNAFWVFIGGLTNQGWSLNVLDTQTARAKFYGNADGTTTVTTTDTAAFTCP